MKLKEKKCRVCGKKFTPLAVNQMYCSTPCKYRANNCHRQGIPVCAEKPRETLKCPVCGELFVPKLYNQKYCSRSCYSHVQNKKGHRHQHAVQLLSAIDMERKVMQYLSLPRKERLKKLETLTNAEKNLAKKMWLRMHDAEPVRRPVQLY